MKPAPDPVLKVLDQMHASRDEAILIGDGVMDIKAAKAAEIPSVAVATGPFTGSRLLDAEPDYLLSSINDLPTLIGTLNATEQRPSGESD
jgi:phosphoglycolate phosphatase-like HAD superfamily hydrolase